MGSSVKAAEYNKCNKFHKIELLKNINKLTKVNIINYCLKIVVLNTRPLFKKIWFAKNFVRCLHKINIAIIIVNLFIKHLSVHYNIACKKRMFRSAKIFEILEPDRLSIMSPSIRTLPTIM